MQCGWEDLPIQPQEPLTLLFPVACSIYICDICVHPGQKCELNAKHVNRIKHKGTEKIGLLEPFSNLSKLFDFFILVVYLQVIERQWTFEPCCRLNMNIAMELLVWAWSGRIALLGIKGMI